MLDSCFLSAIILAGGRSTRMGRDKATIEIDGISLIRRIYDVVASCQDLDLLPTASHPAASTQRLCDRIYVVTSSAEKYRQILPVSCQFIIEPQAYQGPAIAFGQGLAAVSSTWVLLLACDLPNISTPVLQSWIDRLPSIPAESIAYLPKHLGKGWEPLCGFYRRNCHHSLLKYIDNGGQSFQCWLKMNLVTELAVDDPVYLRNCNTPADLADILED
jgi:molybdenum cofactor guanylyltransferase